MILSLHNQAILFLITVVAGLLFGLLYDGVRILRLVGRHPNWLIQVEDFLYWLTVIFFMFLFLLHENYGEIRFFVIFGSLLGMLFYFLTISKPIMSISEAVIRIVKYILFLFLRIVFTPFRLLYLLIRKPVKAASTVCAKRASSCKRVLRHKATGMRQQWRIILKKK